MTFHPLAQALNHELSSEGCSILNMLSKQGKAIFFPSKGILGQGAEAKNAPINATIGTALEDDGSPLTLTCVQDEIGTAKSSFLYAPSFGVEKLREVWKSQITKKNPSLQGKNFSLPVVTAALTHGLSCASYLYLDPEEEVIMPDLYWDNYELIFECGRNAKISTFNTFNQNSFDVVALKEAISNCKSSKKTVLLNFPNNPTGYTPTETEAKAIAQVLLEAAESGDQIVALLDDAYFGLVYEEGVYTESLFSMLADMHPNILAVKLDGPTKEDYVWGFRVGFISFAFKGATEAQLKALEAKSAGFIRANISNAPNPSQQALIEAYTCDQYLKQKEQKYTVLKNRYEEIKKELKAKPHYQNAFAVMPFNSGYFMCVRPIGIDAESIRKDLLKDYGTGVIVCSGLIRLAFSSVPIHQIPLLLENIYNAIVKRQNI